MCGRTYGWMGGLLHWTAWTSAFVCVDAAGMHSSDVLLLFDLCLFCFHSLFSFCVFVLGFSSFIFPFDSLSLHLSLLTCSQPCFFGPGPSGLAVPLPHAFRILGNECPTLSPDDRRRGARELLACIALCFLTKNSPGLMGR